MGIPVERFSIAHQGISHHHHSWHDQAEIPGLWPPRAHLCSTVQYSMPARCVALRPTLRVGYSEYPEYVTLAGQLHVQVRGRRRHPDLTVSCPKHLPMHTSVTAYTSQRMQSESGVPCCCYVRNKVSRQVSLRPPFSHGLAQAWYAHSAGIHGRKQYVHTSYCRGYVSIGFSSRSWSAGHYIATQRQIPTTRRR